MPIRIGVNAGSLPKALADDDTLSTAEKMVRAAMSHVKILEDLDFELIKLSLKAFDVPTTVEAYRRIADMVPYALHLGITEAGLPDAGGLRSAVGLGILLYLGIGDTLRVSLTGDPREEVKVGYEILKSLNLRQRGPVMISCPTCGRTEIDLVTLATQVERTAESHRRADQGGGDGLHRQRAGGGQRRGLRPGGRQGQGRHLPQRRNRAHRAGSGTAGRADGGNRGGASCEIVGKLCWRY